jgi:hypothetical protein
LVPVKCVSNRQDTLRALAAPRPWRRRSSRAWGIDLAAKMDDIGGIVRCCDRVKRFTCRRMRKYSGLNLGNVYPVPSRPRALQARPGSTVHPIYVGLFSKFYDVLVAPGVRTQFDTKP